MALHKGKPSGVNKPTYTGTGIPSDFKPENQKRDHRVTRKYTRDDEEIADGVKLQHPNRNANKRNPTNAGGYKN